MTGNASETKIRRVSTNLDRSGIETRYGAALASRLAGEYEWLEFLGRDIRAQRKEGI